MCVFTVYLLEINSICALNAITLQLLCKHYAIAVYLQAWNKKIIHVITCNYKQNNKIK